MILVARQPKLWAIHLEKVSSPDAKGTHYWHYQWQLLARECVAKRTDTASILSESYRTTHPFSERDFLAKLELERKAIDNLLDFLRNDAAGKHA